MTHIRSISYFKRCRPGGVCRAADDRAGSRIPRDMYVGMRHSRWGRKEESKSDSEVEFQPQASRCREGPSPKHIRIVLCAGMGAGVGTASSRVRRVLLCTCLESIHV